MIWASLSTSGKRMGKPGFSYAKKDSLIVEDALQKIKILSYSLWNFLSANFWDPSSLHHWIILQWLAKL